MRKIILENRVLLLLLISGCFLAPITWGRPIAEGAHHASFDNFSYSGKTIETVLVSEEEYQNPILSGYYPDPSITRVGDDFYLVNSTFTHFPGLPIFHSKDLVNWTQIGNAIDRVEQLNFSKINVSAGVFAPDISYHEGTFYIVNTCVWCNGNFVITAKNPAGPWSDPTWLEFEGIDPSIYWEGNKAYIVNNGAPNQSPLYEGHRAIWVQEFDWKNKKMVGERTQLINGGVDLSKKPIWIEGPHLFKREGFYYITAAEGGTGDAHSQTIFRSKKLGGPFIPASHNPILTQRDLDPNRKDPITSAGHAKFVQLANGDWWATFLATRPYGEGRYNIGRETFLLPVSWKDGWPNILRPGEHIPFVHEKPKLAKQVKAKVPTAGNFEYIDHFDGNRLGMQWIGIRTPVDSFHKISDGKLILECMGGLGDTSVTPSFIGRRQQHHVAQISTTLNFSSDINGTGAGLAAVQNDQALIFFGIKNINNIPNMVLLSRENSSSDKLVASAPLSGRGDILLKIDINGSVMTFKYLFKKKEAILARDVDVTHLSTHSAGGFVGTVIGPYCF